jgi:uncharacterized protein (DUF2164 family)
MKVIFLDNDGVICLSNNWGGRSKKWANYRSQNPSSSDSKSDAPVYVRFDDFDEKAVRVLNSILEETGAEIVVSSDWRFHANLDELGEYYASQGISKKPIAVTHRTEDINPELWRVMRFRADLELERSIEILDWLEKNPQVTHWVAIDDLNMSVDYLSNHFSAKDPEDESKPGLTNFVHTPKSNEGIKQSGVKDKVLKFLL